MTLRANYSPSDKTGGEHLTQDGSENRFFLHVSNRYNKMILMVHLEDQNGASTITEVYY